MAAILDGKLVASRLKAAISSRVAAMPTTPGLAVILVGDNPASRLYVRFKRRACRECGLRSSKHTLPADTSQQSLLRLIAQLNEDEAVHGILIQLPLPKHVDVAAVVQAIDPAKDVDGFHPINVARLHLGESGLRPCTPVGIMRLFEHYHIEPAGKRAVVIGRSRIVGKPMAALLMAADATVTLCHSRTADLARHVGQADILVAAAGRPGLVLGQWVKEGAVVVDVGQSKLPDGRLLGDVNPVGVAERASWLTPVPGGVGPMTVAMLLQNTLTAAIAAGD